MAQTAGYWIDLQGVKFNDDAPTWIQAMPLGDYSHPVYGSIKITPERVQRFANNVQNKVRETDLDIDYDHKAKSSEAAGWVQNAEARNDGLWILVEWTKEAYAKIQNKAYRYFSPEFVDEWEHPKGKGKFHDVLLGGALTNRPFLKDILPINMSEVYSVQPAEPTQKEGGKSMTPEQIALLAKMYGLPDTATAEEVLGAAQVLYAQANNGQQANGQQSNDGQQNDGNQNQNQQNGGQQNQNNGQQQNQQGQNQQAQAAGEVVDPALIALAETNPALAAFITKQQKQLAETQTQLGVTQAALRLSEVHTMTEKLSIGEKFAVAPAVKKELAEVLLLAPTNLSEKLSTLMANLLKTGGVIALGERGSARIEANEDVDGIKAFDDAIKVAMKDNDKLGYADAVEKVAEEQPQLFAEYRKATYAFREA